MFKKFPVLYLGRVSESCHNSHWLDPITSQINAVHVSPSRSVLILSFHQRPGLPNTLSSGCPTKILLSIYPLRATCPSHHKLLYLITGMVFGEFRNFWGLKFFLYFCAPLKFKFAPPYAVRKKPPKSIPLPAEATITFLYTGCNRWKGPDFGRVFLRSNYKDITQNTYIQTWTVTEILAREKSGLLWCLRTVLCPWRHTPLYFSWIPTLALDAAPATLATGQLCGSL
jgi:hypothetical protein